MKTAIVFYSFSGNTRGAAEKIEKELGFELIELNPKKGIPSSGFGKFFVGGMQATFGVKPKLSDFSFDESEYDNIVLGTPIWSGKPAAPVVTFLDRLKNKGKISAVFTFSGGGDNDGCIAYLNKMCPEIRHSVALAGTETKASENNGEKLGQFIKELCGETQNG